MGPDTTGDPARRRSGLLPIVVLALIFGVPFLASVLLYLNPEWLPGTTGNRGVLIDPPVDTRSWAWTEDSGQPYDTSSLQGRWVMLVIADAACSARCEERAYELRQVRRAMGVERARVQRLMVFTEPPAQTARSALREHYPRLPLIVIDPRHPMRAIPGVEMGVGSVVLIDPLGQAMMHYTPTQPAEAILKDLKHLLKVSGDWTGAASREGQ